MAKKKAAGLPEIGDPKVETSPWPGRLYRMKRFQEQNSKTWRRNEKLLFGHILEDSVSEEVPKNVVAYAWAICKALEATVYVQNPECLVESLDGAQAETAQLLSQIMRYDIEAMGLKELGRLHILDNFVYGYGATIEAVDTDYTYDDGGARGFPKTQYYCARRIVPKDILFDPHGLLTDLSDHRYIAFAFYPTISALRQDPLFADNIPSDINSYCEASVQTRSTKGASQNESKGFNSGGASMYAGEEKDPDYKTICVWEIHDKVKGEIIYLTDDHHAELGRMTPDAESERQPLRLQIGYRKLFPVTLMAFNPSVTGFYPVPEIDLIANQLNRINDCEAKIYGTLDAKIRKVVAPEELFDDDNAAKFTDSADPMALIRMSMDDLKIIAGQGGLQGLDVNKLVGTIHDPTEDQDFYLVKQDAKQEIAEIIGYAAGDRGGLPSTRSAREAVAIKDRQDQRLNTRADAIADWLYYFGTKHLQILQQTMQLDRYTRILSEAGKLKGWLQYSKDQIEGSFAFTVYTGTSKPKTTEAKIASEDAFFQTVAPIIMQTGGDIRPLVYRLAKYHQWDGVDQLFRGGKAAVEQLAAALVGYQSGAVKAEDILNLSSQVVMANLTQEEINNIKQQLAGNAGASAGGAPNAKRGDANPTGTARGVA